MHPASSIHTRVAASEHFDHLESSSGKVRRQELGELVVPAQPGDIDQQLARPFHGQLGEAHRLEEAVERGCLLGDGVVQ